MQEMNSSKLPVTVIMFTINEEYYLAEAIENVKPWSSRIFILDSCSTDRTVDIALGYEVEIVQRRFTNFGDQYNFALDHLPITTEWTMMIHPDERLTPELLEDMASVTDAPDSCDGYRMPWRSWFMGRPLHTHIDVLRLWKTGKCRFSDVLVNEHPIIDGRIGHLKGVLEHLDSRDLHHWMDKQNRYTTMEAIMKVRCDPLSVKPSILGNKLHRRMFFKKNFHLLPFRFSLYWLYLMFIKGAWRDGVTGSHWARLRVEIMRMIELKAQEMQTTGRIPDVPRAPHGAFDPRVLSSPLQKSIMLKEQVGKN